MSGGSYNHLWMMETDQLFHNEDVIQAMADRLAGLGYAKDAASETEEFLLTIRQFENRIYTMQKRLRNVWYAVEWWDSGDSGEDGVKLALKEYRGEK